MRKYLVYCLLLAGIVFLASCSGSDSDGGSSVSGKTKLTANNVTDVTQSAFQTTNAVVTSGGAMTDQIGRSSSNNDDQPGRNIIAGFAYSILNFLDDAGLMTDTGVSEDNVQGKSRVKLDSFFGTKQGLYGGTATYNLSKQGTSFRLSIVFDDYTSHPETYLDGTATITGTFDADRDVPKGVMTISYSSFRLRYANSFDYTLTGTMSMEGDMSGAVFTANATIKNQLKGLTSKVENYVIEMTIQSLYMNYKISGQFTHGTYGNVSLSTDQNFKQLLFADHPSEGIMTVEGGEGTKARMTIIDSSSYMIEADLNGDGTYEWNSGKLYWVN